MAFSVPWKCRDCKFVGISSPFTSLWLTCSPVAKMPKAQCSGTGIEIWIQSWRFLLHMDNHFSSTVRISTNQRNGNVDLLMISETKIDSSFPKGQFLIKGFCEPFRIDRNIHEGGILFYVREDIPVKLLSVEPLPTECFFVEINLRKRKWLVCCSYNHH